MELAQSKPQWYHRDAVHACHHRHARYGVIPRRRQQAKHIIAGSIEVQMLAVAIRHSWKLWNIDLCAAQ
jgi:hypothetical protein